MTISAEYVQDILDSTNDLLKLHDAYLEFVVVNAPGDEPAPALTKEEAAFDALHEEAEELNELFDAFFGRKPKGPVQPEVKKPVAKVTEVDLLAKGLAALDAKFEAFIAAQKAGK